MKYLHFLEILDDGVVYTPATIVDNGASLGVSVETHPLARRRLRHALSRLAHNHGFPRQGDGWVEVAGQAPRPGWLGSRWKGAAYRRVLCHDTN